MSTSNGIEEELGVLKTDIVRIQSDLSALAKGLTSEGKKQWDRSRKAVEKSAEQTFSKVSGAVSDLAEDSEEAIGIFQEGIGKRPLLSVAAALGIGFLLGKVLGRD
jgi:ElaB/YqjD/DUF883 family membrane-anchored ribosome-binding protein